MSVDRNEEQRLLRAYELSGARRDRDAVVARFLPLARSLARRYRGGSEPLEDLEQVAYLALVKAVEGFDPSRGYAFTSYAVPCIAGAIKRYFRDSGWSIRPPRDLQELALRVQSVSAELSVTGEVPGVAQIAKHIGVDVEEVLEAREALKGFRSDSLDRPNPDKDGESGGSLLDTLASGDDPLGRAIELAALESLLDTLDARSRLIVTLYYRSECTQLEIAERLGYSQMHISRLLRQAVEQLRLAADRQDRVGRPSLAPAA